MVKGCSGDMGTCALLALLVLWGPGKPGREGRRWAPKSREGSREAMGIRLLGTGSFGCGMWRWLCEHGKPGTAQGECWCGEREAHGAGSEHPPRGHCYVVVAIGALLPAVRVPQEPLVLPEEELRGTDSIEELLVLDFLMAGREGMGGSCRDGAEQGMGQSCKGPLGKRFLSQH